MYLMPLNHVQLKMATMVSFILYIVYHNKKKKVSNWDRGGDIGQIGDIWAKT